MITDAQIKAINYNERSVTLSAAAGSGKTFVLTNRIIKMISEGADVSSLLVVTFTVDAAAEIKSRISAELKKMLEADPFNKNLYLQSLKVQKADICTIDSFYQKLLRRNFAKTDVSPDFQTIDGISYSLLMQRIATETIEEISADNSYKPLFVNVPTQDNSFEDILIRGYNFFSLKPFPKVFFERISSLYDASLYDSIWYGTVLANLSSYLFAIKESYDSFIASVVNDIEINEALKRYYTDDCALIDDCISYLNNRNFDLLKKRVAEFEFSTFRKGKVLSDCKKADEYSELRDSLKKTLIGEKSRFYKYIMLSEENYLSVTASLKTILQLLYRAVEIFTNKLNSELNKLNKLYFAEIQKKCFELLVADYNFENNVVTPSETALEISKQYKEILIDEYQDTNSVQDIIFRAISRNESNIFAVGDVKQCIYSFRGAEPDVFQKRIASETNESIYLSKNFRSREEIIDFVNLIFNNSMRPDTGFTDYENVDRLLFGADDYYKEGNGLAKCVVIDVPEDSQTVIPSDDDEDDKEENILEAEYVANEINELLANKVKVFDKAINSMREIKLSDIVIILRTNNCKMTFAKILNKHGISVFNDTGAEFFKRYEISVILALLKIIDNSKDDLSTAAVLRSPLFGFTDIELASLIVETGASGLTDALNSQYGKNAKVTEFIDKIEQYRALSNSVQVYTLLNYIYTDLHAEALFLATENGREKVNNLINLIYTAEIFENNNVGGLYSFIEYVNEQLSTTNSEKERKPVKEGDFVKIISIHGSKGLEYPVCFICDLFKKFNRNDIVRNVKFDDKYGLCMKVIGENSARKDTLQNSVYGMIIDEKNAKEEQRLLYVAMTRARERLYLVGATKKLKETVRKAVLLTENSEKTTAWDIMNAKRYTDWILPVIFRYKNSNSARKALELSYADNLTKSNYGIEVWQNRNNCDFVEELSANSSIDINELFKKLKMLNNNETKISAFPEKISVSGLKNIDGGDYSANFSFSSKPKFKSNKIDARDKGNAIHKFLRYADWKIMIGKSTDSICSEGEKLKAKNIFTASESSSLDYCAISNFFNNAVTEKLLNAGNVYHEKKFTLNFKANEVISTDNCDEITVQGIIDLFVLSDDGIYLVDFKTDRLSENSSGEELIDKYRIQLDVYQKALERLYEKPIIKKYIYSFAIDKYIEL